MSYDFDKIVVAQRAHPYGAQKPIKSRNGLVGLDLLVHARDPRLDFLIDSRSLHQIIHCADEASANVMIRQPSMQRIVQCFGVALIRVLPTPPTGADRVRPQSSPRLSAPLAP